MVKIVKNKCWGLIILFLFTFVPIITVNKTKSWFSENNTNLVYQRVSTHHWLASEALEMLKEDYTIQWLDSHQRDFYCGIDAVASTWMTEYFSQNISDYIDANYYRLTFTEDGSTIINNSLIVRAQQEYIRFISEIDASQTNFSLAAFHLGALCHYVAQAGCWPTIWNEDYMGSMKSSVAKKFLVEIEQGCTGYISETGSYDSFYFNLQPEKINVSSLENATIELGEKIQPYAKTLHDYLPFCSITYWADTYYEEVKYTLTKTVEAIYSVLLNITKSISIPTIRHDDITINFNNHTNELGIEEFRIYATQSNSSEIIVNQSQLTKTKFHLMIRNSLEDTAYFQLYTEYQLQYNNLTQKWFYPNTTMIGLSSRVYLAIQCTFDFLDMPELKSNYSNSIYIGYFELNFNYFKIKYHPEEFTLDIYDLQFYCDDLPEFGYMNNTIVNEIEWILYSREIYSGFYSMARDVYGDYISGNMIFDSSDSTWYSKSNDIGTVYTHQGIEYIVLIKITLKDIFVGSVKQTVPGGGTPIFYSYARAISIASFVTKDHTIYQTKPEISFNPGSFELNLSKVEAYTDYKNQTLDYYLMIQRYVYGGDRRMRVWNIFHENGAKTTIEGNLQWDFVNKHWYITGINLTSLSDGKYTIRTRFVTMNTNYEIETWGPESEIFDINHSDFDEYILIPIFSILAIIAIPIVFKFIRNIRLNN